jgi:4-hydroxy-2-oxoheptanedioate aldolase
MLGSVFAGDILAKQRLDYVVVDCQHGLNGHDRMIDVLGAVASTRRTIPLVRVPSLDGGWVGHALDAGAEGVIVPMVNTSEHAEAAAAACRFPPLGVRSYGPIRSSRFLGAEPAEMNARVTCLVMVETVAALEHVDEICAVPGVDGIYVGPTDLAVSLGLHPWRDATHRTLLGALDKVRDACLRHGIVPAIHASGGQVARSYLDAGYQMVTAIADTEALRAGVARELSIARGVPRSASTEPARAGSYGAAARQ